MEALFVMVVPYMGVGWLAMKYKLSNQRPKEATHIFVSIYSCDLTKK